MCAFVDKRVLEGQRTVAVSASDVFVWGRGCATRTSVYFDYPNIKKVSSTGRTRELDAPLVCRSGTTAVARGGKGDLPKPCCDGRGNNPGGGNDGG